jgi:hypothetical protein
MRAGEALMDRLTLLGSAGQLTPQRLQLGARRLGVAAHPVDVSRGRLLGIHLDGGAGTRIGADDWNHGAIPERAGDAEGGG